jgi:hypothetical protein
VGYFVPLVEVVVLLLVVCSTTVPSIDKDFHWPALVTYVKSLLLSVQKTINPFAGLTMAVIWLWVILGMSNPFDVDFISSIAELSGLLLSFVIETWAKQGMDDIPVNSIRKNIFRMCSSINCLVTKMKEKCCFYSRFGTNREWITELSLVESSTATSKV